MLETLTATSFVKAYGSGRTKPLYLVCEDNLGEEYEVVVKLRGSTQLNAAGLLYEAFCSLIGAHLELPVLKSYKIEITQEFTDSVIHPEQRQTLQNSIGLNFGVAHWDPGFTIWHTDKAIPRTTREVAQEIFAFDGIIQNPDRGGMKQNCVFRGEDLIIYDHELAFTQFLEIFPKNPWETDGLEFLSNHIFRNSLRGQNVSIERFERSFLTIDRPLLEEYAALIPTEWGSQSIGADRISDYLLSCVENFDDIKTQLETELR